MLAAALVLLSRRTRLVPGSLFASYVAGFSAFRLFVETVRIDPAHHLLGLRLNVFVALAVTSAARVAVRATVVDGSAARDAATTLADAGLAYLAAACAGHL